MATKAELKAEQDKIVKPQMHDLSSFLDENVFGDDGFQNMFIYKPTFHTVQLKKDKAQIMFLVENQSVYILLNLKRCILLSCIV